MKKYLLIIIIALIQPLHVKGEFRKKFDFLLCTHLTDSTQKYPEYIGGAKALRRFLFDHIIYPKAAKEKNIQGTVYVKFVVEDDGKLTDFQIVREPGGGLGDEAIRVLKLSPKWNPGTLNGLPVRVEYTLPVIFHINN